MRGTRRQFRCMFRLVSGSERPGGPGRKCRKRISSEPHKLGRCPNCGCDHMWADATPDVARTRRRQNCTDPRCPYVGAEGVYPHSIYSRECVNNPHRDSFGMTDEPGTPAAGDEAPW